MQPKPGSRRVARGALYLYVESVVTLVLGYIYWFAISALTGPRVVGLASTTVSLAMLVVAAAHLGVPLGVQRFLGRAVGGSDVDSFKVYLTTELIIVSITCFAAASTLILLRRQLEETIGLPREFVLVAGVIVFTEAIFRSLRGAFIALIRTKQLAAVNIVGSASKLVVGVFLVVVGLGALGAVVGYLALSLVTALLLTLITAGAVGFKKPGLREFRLKTREVVGAGVANWVPAIVTAVGLQLGVVVVFGAQGAAEAGLYYIAQAIMLAVMVIPQSISSLIFPVLSGMADGRKRVTWRTLKICLVASAPVVVALATYPNVILGLFGPEYVSASLILVVLLASVVPMAITLAVQYLAYAYGSYWMVLLIGLAANAPRVVLYLALSPLYGGLGAAEAFLAGALIGLAATIYVAYTIKLRIDWVHVAAMMAVPVIVGSAAYWLRVHWILGGILILSVSAVAYIKLRVISKSDLKMMAESFMPQKLIEVSAQKFGWIFRMLYGE